MDSQKPDTKEDALLQALKSLVSGAGTVAALAAGQVTSFTATFRPKKESRVLDIAFSGSSIVIRWIDLPQKISYEEIIQALDKEDKSYYTWISYQEFYDWAVVDLLGKRPEGATLQ